VRKAPRRRRYAAGVRPAAGPSFLLAALCAVLLGACGDTLQDQPIPHNTLEGVLIAPYPVYWLGGSYEGKAITDVTHDPGGAFSIRYGDCVQGGQGTCVPWLRVVTSPDNSFVPGEASAHETAPVRGITALVAQGGRTIEIPTAGVVVGLYAQSPGLAASAARMIVPINEIGAPEAPLPRPLPDTGFAATPLPSQVPAPLRPLR
jgi:hypothetical protein